MASNTDKFRKTHAGVATILTSSIDASVTSIPLASTSGWPTDTAIDIVVDRINTENELTPNKMEVITIVVDATGGINAVRGRGGTLAQAHSSSAIVEPSINSAAAHNDEMDALLVSHKQNGELADNSVGSNQIVSDSIKSEHIGEGEVKSRNIDLATQTISITKPTSMTASTYYTLASFTVNETGLYLVRAKARDSGSATTALTLALYEDNSSIEWVQMASTTASSVFFTTPLVLRTGYTYQLRFRSATANTAATSDGDYILTLTKISS